MSTTQTSLTIGSRKFTIESTIAHAVGPNAGTASYILAGERGARYRTMRNVASPGEMMIIDTKRGKMAAGFESIRLTDVDGTLRVVAS